jgi:hypothetical protein
MSVPVRSAVRSVLGKAYRLVLGPKDVTVMDQMVRQNLDRWTMFVRAIDFVNFEAVEGDVLEFGVFGGVSLALLARANQLDPKGMERRIVGFDSFRGLPDSRERHSRWKAGDCARIHAWHPFLAVGEPVTEEVTLELFRRCGLPRPALEAGWFQDTMPKAIPGRYRAAALIHIDCDTYESTRFVLESTSSILQEGTVLLFDEWFSYQGNPNKGEARAFSEFLDAHPQWGARHYQAYGPFADSFILYRK